MKGEKLQLKSQIYLKDGGRLKNYEIS